MVVLNPSLAVPTDVRMLGPCSKVLGEQERDPRICILCASACMHTYEGQRITCGVSSLVHYVGSRNQNTGDQAWQPSPTQPSCGPQVCILSNFRDSRADGF